MRKGVPSLSSFKRSMWNYINICLINHFPSMPKCWKKLVFVYMWRFFLLQIVCKSSFYRLQKGPSKPTGEHCPSERRGCSFRRWCQVVRWEEGCLRIQGEKENPLACCSSWWVVFLQQLTCAIKLHLIHNIICKENNFSFRDIPLSKQMKNVVLMPSEWVWSNMSVNEMC